MIKITEYLTIEEKGKEISYSEGIRGIRKILGLTQLEFAEEIGLSLDTVKSYEIGRRHPGIMTMGYIKKIFEKEKP